MATESESSVGSCTVCTLQSHCSSRALDSMFTAQHYERMSVGALLQADRYRTWMRNSLVLGLLSCIPAIPFYHWGNSEEYNTWRLRNPVAVRNYLYAYRFCVGGGAMFILASLGPWALPKFMIETRKRAVKLEEQSWKSGLLSKRYERLAAASVVEQLDVACGKLRWGSDDLDVEQVLKKAESHKSISSFDFRKSIFLQQTEEEQVESKDGGEDTTSSTDDGLVKLEKDLEEKYNHITKDLLPTDQDEGIVREKVSAWVENLTACEKSAFLVGLGRLEKEFEELTMEATRTASEGNF